MINSFQTINRTKIDFSELEILNQIGSGVFGNVFVAKCRQASLFVFAAEKSFLIFFPINKINI